MSEQAAEQLLRLIVSENDECRTLVLELLESYTRQMAQHVRSHEVLAHPSQGSEQGRAGHLRQATEGRALLRVAELATQQVLTGVL